MGLQEVKEIAEFPYLFTTGRSSIAAEQETKEQVENPYDKTYNLETVISVLYIIMILIVLVSVL